MDWTPVLLVLAGALPPSLFAAVQDARRYRRRRAVENDAAIRDAVREFYESALKRWKAPHKPPIDGEITVVSLGPDWAPREQQAWKKQLDRLESDAAGKLFWLRMLCPRVGPFADQLFIAAVKGSSTWEQDVRSFEAAVHGALT